jgi:AraC-like DNA-binding protein
MDNPDIRHYHQTMGEAQVIGFGDSGQFAGSLWGFHRSAELTPLYALRFRGPRTARRLGYHDFWELIAIRNGNGSLLLDGAEQGLQTGDVVLIPPLCKHTEVTAATMDLIWIGLQGSLLAGLARDHPQVINDSTLAARIEEFWLFAEFHSHPSGIELDGLARQLLGSFLRRQASAVAQPGDQIGRVLAWLNEHFDQPLSVAALARESGLSEGHFHRLFKTKTGRSPMDYLNLVRLRHAEQLLRFTDFPISEVAVRSGFPDPLYFSRAFKKTWGQSPRDHRARSV